MKKSKIDDMNPLFRKAAQELAGNYISIITDFAGTYINASGNVYHPEYERFGITSHPRGEKDTSSMENVPDDVFQEGEGSSQKLSAPVLRNSLSNAIVTPEISGDIMPNENKKVIISKNRQSLKDFNEVNIFPLLDFIPDANYLEATSIFPPGNAFELPSVIQSAAHTSGFNTDNGGEQGGMPGNVFSLDKRTEAMPIERMLDENHNTVGNENHNQPSIKNINTFITSTIEAIKNFTSTGIGNSNGLTLDRMGGEEIIPIDGFRQSGGPVSAGKNYIVGEGGPEILSMGNTSGTVVPNDQIGGSNTFNIILENVNISTGADNDVSESIVNQVKSALDELARNEFSAEAGLDI